MKRFLIDGVFMACCDEDIVVLDTRTDLYSCLPEAAGVIALSPGAIEGPAQVLEDLRSIGLVTETSGRERRPLPRIPTRALRLDEAAPSLRDRATVLGAMVSAWMRGPGQQPLHRLINPAHREAEAATDLALVARLTAAFVSGLPWDPAQGACLYRAWLLREVLRLRGQTATWVFGVRTWPFGAHCWLQIGDAVLDDEPDRVARYTPIMVV